MLGGDRKQAVLVLVDRKTRYAKLGLLRSRDGRQTSLKTLELLRGLPCKTMTSDRGPEFIEYESLAGALSAKFYFCTPYTASERGTNENTIGLIRQYLPKRFEIAKLTERKLREIEAEFNNRPRKCLDWKTPAEVFFR